MMKYGARCIRNRVGVVVASLAVSVTASVTQGAIIDFVAANVGQTPLFTSMFGPMGEWTIPNASLTNGSVLSNDFRFLELAPTSGPAGSFTWTGSALASDNSSGGNAFGVFFDGGELVITGKLIEFGFMEIFDGELLRASVADFSVFEPAGGDNFIDTGTGVRITPLSGALVDGSLGFEMPTDYFLGFTGALAQQSGGPLVDFQTDIVTVTSFQFELSAIPEPSSLILFAGLFVGMATRRRIR